MCSTSNVTISLRFLSFPIIFGLSLAAPPPKSGNDTTAIDKTCKPCDDFWRFANGAWVDKNPIPASRSSWGTMSVMTEGNRERLRVILEAAALAKSAPGSNEQKIGDMYGACMDTGRREALEVTCPRVKTDAGFFEVVYAGATGAMQSFGNRVAQDDILKINAYVNSLKKK